VPNVALEVPSVAASAAPSVAAPAAPNVALGVPSAAAPAAPNVALGVPSAAASAVPTVARKTAPNAAPAVRTVAASGAPTGRMAARNAERSAPVPGAAAAMRKSVVRERRDAAVPDPGEAAAPVVPESADRTAAPTAEPTAESWAEPTAARAVSSHRCRAGRRDPPGSDSWCTDGPRLPSASFPDRPAGQNRVHPASTLVVNGRPQAGFPRRFGCPERGRSARPAGMRTTGRHRMSTDRAGAAPATEARPIAAVATAVRRSNAALLNRPATGRCCGARSTRNRLPARRSATLVAVRSHTNTHRYRRRPTPSRVHPVRTRNPPYGCGRHDRATNSTRVPLGREDLIGHSSAPDG
jgi:hypothetical protein